MARKSLEQRIAQLDEQKKTLQTRLSKQNRARDTRRKILLGAIVLDRLESRSDEMSEQLNKWLKQELPGFLTRKADRELFEDLIGPSK